MIAHQLTLQELSEGAPLAVQVADRFHLLKNLREALEKLLLRQERQLRRQTMTVKLKTSAALENDSYEQCRVRLLPHLRRVRRSRRKDRVAAKGATLPTPRQAAWMLLMPEKLRDEEKKIIEDLCQFSPEIKSAEEISRAFVKIFKKRKADELRAWLIDALKCHLPEFVSFASGITEDLQAVKAALTCEWSQGQVEGQVNRLKMIKRQMYGRANFDLLRARVLHRV